ncbi:MAG: extracellular solute-binding protein [Chloroflexi bacterium]|nr:extracellular solute-binding protein [Chloroflexota bacterium]
MNIILSSSFFDDGKSLPKFEQALNATYGTNIKVQRNVGPSMPQEAATVAQEVAAGKTPSTDLYMGSDEHIATLLQANALESIDWRSLDPRIPAGAVAENNVGLAYASWLAGISYNEKLIPPDQAPQSLQDVLDPKWKGKFASTPYAAGFYRLALPNQWGEQKTTDYVQKLANQIGGLIRCGEESRLLSGEFQGHLLNCGVNDIQRQRRNGAPLNFVVPSDALELSYYNFAVPKKSAHPNAATLFALFMLTPQGQSMYYDSDFMDLHLLPNSKVAAMVKPLLDKGGKLLGEDMETNMTKYAADMAKYEQLYPNILLKK